MPKPVIRGSIYIQASPQDVFDLAVRDLASMPDWMSGIESIESTDPNWPAAGSSHVYVRTVGKSSQRGRTTIVEVDEPHRVVMQEEVDLAKVREAPEKKGHTIWTFEPEGTGTRMTSHLEGAELKFGLWLVFRVLIQPQVGKRLTNGLQRLKVICEEELEEVLEEAPSEEPK